MIQFDEHIFSDGLVQPQLENGIIDIKKNDRHSTSGE